MVNLLNYDFISITFFEFSVGGLINFLLGIFSGFILFSLMFVFIYTKGKGTTLNEVDTPNKDVEEKVLRKIIFSKQNLFKKKKNLGVNKYVKTTIDLSYELINEISQYYYPNSRYPMYELSVHEAMELNRYIIDRIDELLGKPLLKATKNLKIAQMIHIVNKKNQFDNTKIVKAAKKYRVGKVLKYGSTVLNAINPAFWFRKLVINTSIDLIIKKTCVIAIGIVGEETNKVYSKKIFMKPIELDIVSEEVDSLLIDLKEESEDDDVM